MPNKHQQEHFGMRRSPCVVMHLLLQLLLVENAACTMTSLSSRVIIENVAVHAVGLIAMLDVHHLYNAYKHAFLDKRYKQRIASM